MGPSTDPCCTPDFNGYKADERSLAKTNCEGLIINPLIYLTAVGSMILKMNNRVKHYQSFCDICEYSISSKVGICK